MCGGSRGSSTVVAADPAVSQAPNVQQQSESAAKTQADKQRKKKGNSSNMVSMDRNQLGGSTILDAAVKKELG